ncbi:hypothetical protein ACFQ21_12750 [Ohtaekwangia kribbensis]|uniref:Uncharacterized protein n=1 Tax=Ohtaekwangia kribbensis TaxID=688913 RepID=A0ABW3K4L9_9BACT
MKTHDHNAQGVKSSLIAIEADFNAELNKYINVVETATLVSQNQGGVSTDGRGIRSSRIFTRQVLSGLSLLKLLSHSSPHDLLWDVGSVASLSRNLIEGFLSLYYFGLEKISDEEAELRFFIAQRHRNIELYNIRKAYNIPSSELEDFKNGIPIETDRIKNHLFFKTLTEAQKKRILNGAEMYKTRQEFEAEIPFCKGLIANYRQLSNLVHPLPLYIEQISNDHGRGLGSVGEIGYCLLCTMFGRKYLAASTVGIVDHFPNHFSSQIKKEIDNLRNLIHEGF